MLEQQLLLWQPGDRQLTDCFFSFLMVHGGVVVEKEKLEGRRKQIKAHSNDKAHYTHDCFFQSVYFQ